MSLEGILSPAAVGIISFIMSLFLKRTILGEMDKISVQIMEMKRDAISSRELMIKDYSTKEDVVQKERDNKESHAQFWSEANLLRERVTVIETIQKNCKACSGKD